MTQQGLNNTLISLLADGGFHSGTDLARLLGISRSAVWKQLQGLGAMGLSVHAVPGKGYRLGRPLQLLCEANILSGLDSSVAEQISALEIHQVIDSTNAQLMKYGVQGAPSGQICLAEHQVAGRGRRGRQWVSPFGHNVYFSLLWRYADGPASIAGLSLAVGVAVIRALKAVGVEGVALKWPNDIYWQQRKLGGILIEVSGESGGPCFAVIGLGINVHMSSELATEIDQPWVDIETIIGVLLPEFRNRLVAALINVLVPVVAEFDVKRLADYLPEWRRHDALYGKDAALLAGSQHYDGVVSGIDDTGMLLITLPGGEVRAFGSGEVTFKR